MADATNAPTPDGAAGQGSSAPTTPDGAGQRSGEPIRDMAEFQRVVQQRDELKTKFADLEKQFGEIKSKADADALAKNKAEGNTAAVVETLQKQLDETKTLLADATSKLTEAGRRDRRRVITDVVLSAADPAHQEVLRHALVGLAEAGELDLNAEDASSEGAKVLGKLTKRFPAYFRKEGAATGGSPAGPTASLPPNVQWGDLTPEQRERMTDDDFSKLFGRDRAATQQRRGIW